MDTSGKDAELNQTTSLSERDPDVIFESAQDVADNTKLIQRMEDYFTHLTILARARGVGDGYGNPLTPTGGVLSMYMICERKRDRLRNQLYRKILDRKPINPKVLDTIDDEINYLLFLRFMIEDEAPVS